MIANDFTMLGSDIIYAPYLKYKNTKYSSKNIQFSHSSGNDLHEKHEYSSLSFKTINKRLFPYYTIEYIFYYYF